MVERVDINRDLRYNNDGELYGYRQEVQMNGHLFESEERTLSD